MITIDEKVEEVIGIIVNDARTGQAGDGKYLFTTWKKWYVFVPASRVNKPSG